MRSRPFSHPFPAVTASVLLSTAWMLGGGRAGAQQPTAEGSRPSAQDAQTMLQTRPDLVATLQQRMAASGLSPEQIRARLKAAGYPEAMLDAYLPSAGGGSNAARGPAAPSGDVLAAVNALGIPDSDTTAVPGATDRRSARRSTAGGRSETSRGESGRGDLAHTDSTTRDAGREALPVFGASVFAAGSSAFDPNLGGPVDATYRLGPGDRLVVLLSGAVEGAHTLDVTREGFVIIPQVGQLPVANLTLGQFEDLLERRLRGAFGSVQRGTGPASPSSTRFTVSIAKLRTNQVSVVGEVATPGSYRVSSAGTALTALYAAGGPNAGGSLRQVVVRRGGQIVATLDLYRYLLTGDAGNDVRLENGDVVFVPVVGPQVQVRGEVRRPATYELRAGETLADAVRMSGGFTATAAGERVQIERVLPQAQRGGVGHERVLMDVSAAASTGGEVPALPLVAGDVVRVAPVTARVTNRVTVRGNVWSPGDRGITAGTRLSDVLARAGLKPDTYLGDVLVSRMMPDSSRVQLHAQLADTTGATRGEFVLADADEIQVFSTAQFRPARFVAITGAVRHPGRYPYRAGMTLRDVALLAGGFEEGAALDVAEVAHMASDRSDGREAVTERVRIDSTYAFTDVPTGRGGAPGRDIPEGRVDIALRPYDNVLILRQENYAMPRTVTLQGEVRAPGVYTLRHKGERLADVVTRAGGFTSEAYAAGATLHRAADSLGYLGVDVPAAMRDARDRDNVTLEDGDVLTVPRYRGVVVVRGAVHSPTTVAYVPGRAIGYYIDAAGGATEQADVRAAYVREANGRIVSVKRHRLRPDGAPTPLAGAVVTVPLRDTTQPRRDFAPLLTGIGSSLTALIGLIAVSKK